jgi:2'-5' RNA ligase
MRAFIGTLLSEANQDMAEAFAAKLVRKSGGVLRPVPLRSAHVTHVFLGDVDEPLARFVIRDLQQLMTSLAPVPFRLGEPEVLRTGREPRLVHAKVDEGGRAVSAVTHRIVEQVRRQPALASIAPARSPHVTLARFRRRACAADATRVFDLIAELGPEPRWQADELRTIELIRSELTPAGPVYTVVARAPAGGPA